MKRMIIITLALILSAGLSQVNSQVETRLINKAANKAEERTEDKIEDEAEKGVEKQVNKAFNKLFGTQEAETPSDSSAAVQSSDTPSGSGSRSSSSAGSDAMRNAYLNAMGITSGNAKVKPEYQFDGFIEMSVTEFKKGKEEESTLYTTYVDSKSFDYGIHFTDPESDDETLIVFDTDNNLMLTLADADGQRTGFAVAFTPEQAEAMAEEEAEEAEPADAYLKYKTGKKKKILGYNCEEYFIEDDDETVTMWVTRDLNNQMKKSYMQNSTFAGLFAYAYYTDGVVMEYIIEDKDNGDKDVMTVTDIDLDSKKSFATMGYNIMDMSGLMPDEDDDEGDADHPAEEE